MSNLKTLRNRIKTVKSTQKITKAMKMVAASKLRRARQNAEAAAPYAKKMEEMLHSIATSCQDEVNLPLLSGTGKSDNILLVISTSDRGLCGAFNGSIIKAAKRKIQKLETLKKNVKILLIGKKAHDALKSGYEKSIIHKIEGLSKKPIVYEDAKSIADYILQEFANGSFDECYLFYNKFISAISQKLIEQQLIPLTIEKKSSKSAGNIEFEPDQGVILGELLPKNIAIQIFNGLLENSASEQGARMTAMDNATRNAGEMIKNLTLKYNRTRQAAITKELIEIISGAEAV